jgi:hypothetical protein
MDDAQLPNDLAECQQLLLAAFKKASELERVLDQTAASYEQLQETHRAAIDELKQLKRWIYGQRRERMVEGEGQLHLFDLDQPTADPRPTRRRSRSQLNIKSQPTVAVAVASLISTSCRTTGMSSMYHPAKRPAVVVVARRIVLAATNRSSWTMCRPSWKSTCMCVLNMRAATARTAW